MMEVIVIARRATVVLVLFVALAAVGVARADHRSFRGDAIYYSDAYSGDTMACGGAYRPYKMVAAHRTLPCGTKVRVKNLSNGRTVTVTVRDRGPFGGDAVIDVSRAAAEELRFISAGRTRVKVTVLH